MLRAPVEPHTDQLHAALRELVGLNEALAALSKQHGLLSPR
jgi:hypothetical protein